MGELIHTSRAKIIRDAGPVRRAFIEDFEEPFYYGVHGKIAEFYGVTPEIEYPATLDHIISAVAGWLTGTFAGALAARGIKVAPGELTSTAEGDIEKTEHTIKISEIRVRYQVPIPADKMEEAERALQVHPAGCPAHESVKEGIRIKIDADFTQV